MQSVRSEKKDTMMRRHARLDDDSVASYNKLSDIVFEINLCKLNDLHSSAVGWLTFT